MKHQQVSVDYWAMGKNMMMYAVMVVVGWMMLRMFNNLIMLPRRMRTQQRSLQDTLAELQKRFPGMNISEEDLLNAEKELEEYIQEEDNKKLAEKLNEGKENLEEKPEDKEKLNETLQPVQNKKTI